MQSRVAQILYQLRGTSTRQTVMLRNVVCFNVASLAGGNNVMNDALLHGG